MNKTSLLTSFYNPEAHSKLPLVELCGDSRVLIENHSGVLSYGQNEITVRVSFGCVRVTGQNMRLAEMHRDQLVIFGQIDGVFLHGR